LLGAPPVYISINGWRSYNRKSGTATRWPRQTSQALTYLTYFRHQLLLWPYGNQRHSSCLAVGQKSLYKYELLRVCIRMCIFTVSPKRGHHSLVHILTTHSGFSKKHSFTGTISGKFAIKLTLKNPATP